MNNRPTYYEVRTIYRKHIKSKHIFAWINSYKYYEVLNKFGIKVCEK